LNFENFSLRPHKVPCDRQNPPEIRIESKNRNIIGEVIVVSLGKKKHIMLKHSLPHSESNTCHQQKNHKILSALYNSSF